MIFLPGNQFPNIIPPQLFEIPLNTPTDYSFDILAVLP